MLTLCKNIKKYVDIKTIHLIDTLEGGSITYTKQNVQRFWNKVKNTMNLLTHLHPNEEDTIVDFTNSTIREYLEIIETKTERSYRPVHAQFDKLSFVNLTNIIIPDDIAMILSFGPKFCFPPEDNLMNTIRFLDNIDLTVSHDIPIEAYGLAYKLVSIEMTKTRSVAYKTTRDVWLDFLKYRLTAFRKIYPDIYITRSDKGKHTIVIDKNDYINKMNGLVNSTMDYIPIDNVQVEDLENKNNHFIEVLIKCGTIDGENKFEFVDFCSTPSRLYGLIKIHKKDYPVRPIVSACSSPGFKLAGLITTILSSIFNEQGFHIKDSFDFVKKLEGFPIQRDEVMISFDVVSMFTNIPIDHMIQLIHERGDEIENRYRVKFGLFKEILLFLLKDCAVFTFNDLSYKQRDSLAMGSPLSPILARILMTDIITFTLEELKFRPRIISLYVDDSFWIVNSQCIDTILDTLNSYHPKIKFTVETERDSKINFLDVTIIRDNGEILTNWYRKPFASLRILNYFSHHEKSCIVETAIAFMKRIMKLSDGRFFNENKAIITDILRSNSFPESEIITLIHNNYTFMRPDTKKKTFRGRYIPIYYRGSLTKRIKQRLTPFLDNARLVGIPDRCDSKHFSIIKDRTPLKDKTNVIITLECNCHKYMIIKHTKYKQRADNVLVELNRYNREEGKCGLNGHRYNRLVAHQCKHFSSMRSIYDMLTFALKHKLLDTKIGLPVFQVTKHIVAASINENTD